MKPLILSALLLLSVPARSMGSMCSSLFLDHPYTSALAIESALFSDAQRIFPLIKADNQYGYFRTLKPKQEFIYTDLSNIHAEKELEAIQEISPAIESLHHLAEQLHDESHSENIARNLDLRLKGAMVGIIMRTHEYLEAAHISHDLDYNGGRPFLTIETRGSHYLNKLANRLKKKYNLTIRINPYDLIEQNQAATFKLDDWYSKQSSMLSFLPTIFDGKSVLMNEIVSHEFAHLLALATVLTDPQVYHGTVVRKVPIKGAESYINYFTIHELVAYRASIRSLSHKAIMDKDDSATKNYLAQIKRYADIETQFSQIISEALIDPHHDYMIEAERNSYYKKHPQELAQKLFKTAHFTNSLYKIISKKIEDAENSSPQEQRLLLRKIAKLLSQKNIKDLNGNYPSNEEIQTALTGY